MAYQIDRYNNTLLTTVEDGTVDQTTDLKFIGKNYAGYGEIQNENMLFLLENFAGTVAPPRALSGQLWYDTANNKIKFYDGNQWKASGGALPASSSPTGSATGDFWWDNANDQLYVYNGTNFTLIGPQNAGEGLTQMQSLEVISQTDGLNKNIITATINDTVAFIISNEEFQIDASNAITGFDIVRKGVTLKWTQDNDNGITNSAGTTDRNYEFHGTASAALGLVKTNPNGQDTIVSLDNLVQTGDGASVFSDVLNIESNNGMSIGENGNLSLTVEDIDGIATGVIKSPYGVNSQLAFQTTDALGTIKTIAIMKNSGIMPGVAYDDVADTGLDIGSVNSKWRDVYAERFRGTADRSNELRYSIGPDRYATGSQLQSNNTVAVRTSDGDLVANLFQGTATSARYADLAEKYSTGEELAPGTVVTVCAHEDHEVEAASVGTIAIGVVSTDPAVMMNSEAEGQYIGLKGRLPVRVTGAVKKGQAVYVDANGCASTAINGGSLVGVALESNSDEGEKLVECVLKV